MPFGYGEAVPDADPFVEGWPTIPLPGPPTNQGDSARHIRITNAATGRSRPHWSHASGDVDWPGHTGRPQEFRKNLLRIRQGVGRNLEASDQLVHIHMKSPKEHEMTTYGFSSNMKGVQS